MQERRLGKAEPFQKKQRTGSEDACKDIRHWFTDQRRIHILRLYFMVLWLLIPVPDQTWRQEGEENMTNAHI
jgi:hypothetical protein